MVTTIYDHKTGQRLCFLQNAFDIEYSINLNGLHTARFSLPAEDEKNAYCTPFNYVELFDGDERVELFRIMPYTFTRTADTHAYTYECEHVLAVLMDDVLFGWHELGNMATPQIMRYVLDRQVVTRWQLGRCDFTDLYQYAWENENLLSALLSIPASFAAAYRWTFDTTVTPWVLNLIRADEAFSGKEIRYRKNMSEITKTVDATNLTTRLYCLGYGEGDNQLTIGSPPYLDADTIDRYGIISKIYVDRSQQTRESLRAAGRAVLEATKEPYVSYMVQATDKAAAIGEMVRVIDDEDGIEFYAVVAAVTVSQDNVTVQIANKVQDVAATIADLSDRQRIADLYAQGATNIDSHDFADNCDASNPATLRFYIPAEAVRINAVKLTYSFLPFRSFSKGVASGGGSSVTSKSGGGRSATSDAGGGDSVTSESGGRATVSYSPTYNSVSSSYPKYDDGEGIEEHYHTVGTGTMAHSHTVPGHTHKVAIPDHRHSFDIPSHTHKVDVPTHTHDMQHGIFTGTKASAATIKVDGRAIPATADTELDIVQYLATDNAGKITRSAWHSIEIIPNLLTRIEASVMVQVFINSRGKGDY
ncbi:phage tail spike protein [Oscillospiraceae bacterium LTW-04]|nr:phage tail spike protein [Oscillospiraceae bacterium MB24-C1]